MSLLTQIAGLNTAELNDQTEIVQGGGGRGLLPTGAALVRPFLYIELGSHTVNYDGKPKPSTPQFQIGVKVVGGGGKNLQDQPEKFVTDPNYFPEIVTYPRGLTFTDKSQAPKILAALNKVGVSKTHMALKVADSELYFLDIGTKKNKEGRDVQTYDFANLRPATRWDDEQSMEVPIKAPTLDEKDMKIFIWDIATKEMWDSIHVEGQWEAKKDDSGKIIKPAQSKNKYQEMCYEADNFEGSVLQTMLASSGAGFEMPNLDADATENVVPDVPSVPDVPDNLPF